MWSELNYTENPVALKLLDIYLRVTLPCLIAFCPEDVELPVLLSPVAGNAKHPLSVDYPLVFSLTTEGRRGVKLPALAPGLAVTCIVPMVQPRYIQTVPNYAL